MNYELFDDEEILALLKQDMKNQKYDFALEKTKFLLKKERVSVELFAVAGRLFATLTLFEKAKFFYSEYIKNVPDAYIELFQLGMVEKDTSNFDRATEIWENVLEINPRFSEALYYLADLKISLQQYDDGRSLLLQLLENAHESDPYVPMADQLINRIKAH